MLQKEFFLRICKYANANWKACLSGTEMNEQAEDILNTIMNDFKVRESDGVETE